MSKVFFLALCSDQGNEFRVQSDLQYRVEKPELSPQRASDLLALSDLWLREVHKKQQCGIWILSDTHSIHLQRPETG